MILVTQHKLNYSISLFCLFSIVVFAVVMYKRQPSECVPKHLHVYLQVPEHYKVDNVDVQLEVLLPQLEKRNEQREVKNWQEFGPVEGDTPVLVVRAHRDLERLQCLVISLAQVADIRTVLLVFSHTFYDDTINRLIQKIDFCMVLQIFYPHSVQLRRKMASDYCTNKSVSTNVSCTEHDGQLTESKHHWWWTAHFVFEHLVSAQTHGDNMVVFIEEDSYVLPDFLFMLRLAKYSLSYITDASVLSFGRSPANDLEYDKLIVEAWRPPYDKGLAFNRSTWRRISALGSFYCQYDDTSWSYSLLRLFEQFPRGRAVMVASMAPRVIATGLFRSGTHALANICRMIRRDRLFPGKVHAVTLFGHHGRLLRDVQLPLYGNGGWSDERDRYLCSHPMISFSSRTSTTTRTELKYEP